MLYPVEYEVMIYDEFDEKMETRHGVTIAESFTDAMDKIESYYGKDLDKVTIVLLEEGTVYDFKDSMDNHYDGLLKIENVSRK